MPPEIAKMLEKARHVILYGGTQKEFEEAAQAMLEAEELERKNAHNN